MDEPFELPVNYQGKELLFSCQLLQNGYTHKFLVQVDGVDIFYEPDEERNYRAVINPDQVEEGKIDVELLQAIAAALEAVIE